MEYVDKDKSSGTAMLGEMPLPEFQEISDDPEFDFFLITKDEFEKIWLQAYSNEKNIKEKGM